jgi:hypothetical protein
LAARLRPSSAASGPLSLEVVIAAATIPVVATREEATSRLKRLPVRLAMAVRTCW